MSRKVTEESKLKKYILRMSRMLFAINYLGRYCEICGIDGFNDPSVMDFDHKDPSLKLYDVKNRLYHGNFSTYKDEIDKCRLVCANCHRIHHFSNDLYKKYKKDILKKLNEINSKPYGKLRVPPLDTIVKEKIFKLAEDGYNRIEINNIVGVGYDRIKYLLKSMKIKVERAKIRIPKSTILRMLNQKHSIRNIAKKTGINRETIRLWISENVSYNTYDGVKVYYVLNHIPYKPFYEDDIAKLS